MRGGTSPGANMSRRALAVLALVSCTSLTACADSVTAPPQQTLAPSAPRHDAVSRSSCKGGYIMSEGRCR
jgi:hypothetical protein